MLVRLSRSGHTQVGDGSFTCPRGRRRWGNAWLFLDAKKTGTKGDTEKCPRLVGLAWWDGGGIEVKQLFLREARDEHSVLIVVAERLAECRVDVIANRIPHLTRSCSLGRRDGPILVFQQNQMDLQGVAGVATRVLTLLADDDCASKEALELFGASRVCERGTSETRPKACG